MMAPARGAQFLPVDLRQQMDEGLCVHEIRQRRRRDQRDQRIALRRKRRQRRGVGPLLGRQLQMARVARVHPPHAIARVERRLGIIDSHQRLAESRQRAPLRTKGIDCVDTPCDERAHQKMPRDFATHRAKNSGSSASSAAGRSRCGAEATTLPA
jgi:hypothetical protein